jgi:probable HAF family extracellular repeat protein
MKFFRSHLFVTLLVLFPLLAAASLSAGTWTSIDYPGQPLSAASGINNSGAILGIYQDASSAIHQWILQNGIFTIIDVPNASVTEPSQINNLGHFVGYYVSSIDGNTYGYYYDGQTFTTLQFPGARFTYPSGINDKDEIVGGYVDTSNVNHGFTWSNGTFTTFDYPGAVQSGVNAISNQGLMVGYYDDAKQIRHNYGYDATGKFRPLNLPKFSVVQGGAVNIHGTVVGTSSSDGFRDNLLRNIYFQLSFPNAEYTIPKGINDSGSIVGFYADQAGVEHGFLFTN